MTAKQRDNLVMWGGSLGITIIGVVVGSWLMTGDLDARELHKKIDSKADQTELTKTEERLQKSIDENKEDLKEFKKEYTRKIDKIYDYIINSKTKEDEK